MNLGIPLVEQFVLDDLPRKRERIHVMTGQPIFSPNLTPSEIRPLRAGLIKGKQWLIHPGRLTWNLQITHLERTMIGTKPP